MTGHALSVRQLRFRGRIANSLATRGRVEMALAAGASRLEGEAILCVRRIAIALPRVDNLSAALDAERSSAARPARDAVPANANAILFADRAELLACLARDWCGSKASASWWWSVLFPRDDFATIVRRAWLDDARPVPAALERLESVGLAARFLTTLPPSDVATLWRNIVNTFQLPALDAAWGAIDPTPAAPLSSIGLHDSAPWAPWLTVDPSLAIGVARVLVTALLLERAPGKIRSDPFAQAVRAWSQPRKTHTAPESGKLSSFLQGASRKDAFPDSESPGIAVPSARNGPLPAAQSASTGSSNKSKPDVNQSALPQPLEESQDSVAVEDRSSLTRSKETTPVTGSAKPIDQNVIVPPRTRPDRIATGPGDRRNDSRIHDGRSKNLPFESSGPIPSSGAPSDESMALPLIAPPDRIASEWGGLLYLANVAIALELYGDFSTPARPGLALSLWDFLALVGGRMIGEEFAQDPLHHLFAKLSGRADHEPAGADFAPPTGETLAIWLDRICDEIQARVAASLGVSEQSDLRALVLNHHAKIETTSARLDAYFSLESHPIALRLAGLDRDPGWVPAGGRSIYFHYD